MLHIHVQKHSINKKDDNYTRNLIHTRNIDVRLRLFYTIFVSIDSDASLLSISCKRKSVLPRTSAREKTKLSLVCQSRIIKLFLCLLMKATLFAEILSRINLL